MQAAAGQRWAGLKEGPWDAVWPWDRAGIHAEQRWLWCRGKSTLTITAALRCALKQDDMQSRPGEIEEVSFGFLEAHRVRNVSGKQATACISSKVLSGRPKLHRCRTIPTPRKSPRHSGALPRPGISPGDAVEGAAKGNPLHPSSRPMRAEAALEQRQRRAALSCTSPAGLLLEGRSVVGEPLLAQRTDADYFKPYC